MTSLRLQFRDLRELQQWIINESVYLPVTLGRSEEGRSR